MRAHLQHEGEGGKLRDAIPEPFFSAEPSHRIKVMAKPIFKMVTTTKDPTKCKKIDSLRVKKIHRMYDI